VYSSNFGNTDPAPVVDDGNVTGDPARTTPVAGGTDAPSRVTSRAHVPLKARARSM